MSSDNMNSKEKIHEAKTHERQAPSLFSEEEVKNIVREFILAWLRGNITIDFPEVEEFLEKSKAMKLKVDFKHALNQSRQAKKFLIDLVSICIGDEEAKPEERRKAISTLFSTILVLRSSERIKGRLVEFNIEDRFSRLEEQMRAINELVREISFFLRNLGARDS